MNHISQIVIGVALLSCTAVCASEVFGMCDPSRPRGNNEALTALKRRKHVYCEPRLRLLWDFQSVAAILATAVTILAGRSAEAVAMIVAVVMFAIWDGGRRGGSDLGSTTPVRIRWQDHLVIRTSLQTVALCALCAAALLGPS